MREIFKIYTRIEVHLTLSWVNWDNLLCRIVTLVKSKKGSLFFDQLKNEFRSVHKPIHIRQNTEADSKKKQQQISLYLRQYKMQVCRYLLTTTSSKLDGLPNKPANNDRVAVFP